MECIILSVNDTYMGAQEVMHMTDYSKITALYSRLSVGDEDRDGGESNSIQNQKIFLENYARGQHLTNIRHYIDAPVIIGLKTLRREKCWKRGAF